MKYLLGFLFGLLLGAACAFGLLYLNPLTAGAAAPAAAVAPVLRYSLDKPHLLASTHNDLLPLPRVPAGVPLLWESGVRGSWMQVLALETESGTLGAVATRLNVPSVRSNAVTAGIVTDDQWLITLPGRGTLYAYGRSNFWPLLKDTVVRVNLLGREWPGTTRYDLLSGPAGGAAAVVGLTGEFAGSYGSLSEVLQLDDYVRGGFAELSSAVTLELEAASPEAAE